MTESAQMIPPSTPPSLSDYEVSLGLPAGFAQRDVAGVSRSRVDEVLRLKALQRRRTYLLGVLLSYVGVAERLLAANGIESVEDVFTTFPRRETDSKGAFANTLTFGDGDSVISLRTVYNLVETVIRHDLHRPHYPNSAPHATQSWSQHQTEFELVAAMSPAERTQLVQELWEQVLAIPEMTGDTGAAREIRPFEFLLENFASSVPGEPGGAVLQGLAYAYYRADSPSVTLRVYKVGSGSSRVGAAGDVDGWVGGSLALSVEVKDYPIVEADLSTFDQFIKQLSRWPNCTAVALASSFDDASEQWLAERNVLTFDRPRMASNVAFWDLPKQKMAVREFYYFINVVQGHAKLIARFHQFCEDYEISLVN